MFIYSGIFSIFVLLLDHLSICSSGSSCFTNKILGRERVKSLKEDLQGVYINKK